MEYRMLKTLMGPWDCIFLPKPVIAPDCVGSTSFCWVSTCFSLEWSNLPTSDRSGSVSGIISALISEDIENRRWIRKMKDNCNKIYQAKQSKAVTRQPFSQWSFSSYKVRNKAATLTVKWWSKMPAIFSWLTLEAPQVCSMRRELTLQQNFSNRELNKTLKLTSCSR